MGLHQLKNFCLANHQQAAVSLLNGRICLQIIYFDKELMSKICEGLIQVKSKKPCNWILKWTEELCRHFSKKGHANGHQYEKKCST